jgi:iron complex transport system permease protein
VSSRKKYLGTVLLLVFVLGITSVAGMCIGRYSVNPLDAFHAIIGRLTGNSADESMDTVLFVIRIPRILSSIVIGAALSLAGAVYQSVFKNPLVAPDILGVSNGACVGAAISILIGTSVILQQVSAFAGGILAVLMTIAIPKLLNKNSNLMMVLSGIIISAFMSSMLGLLKFVAEEDTQLASIVYWQLGSIANVKMSALLSVSPVLFISGLAMVLLSWRLNIMSFGDAEAKTLGLNLTVLRVICVVGASLLTAASVCLTGNINWIGLIVPHLGRLIMGSDNTKLLPVTMLLGAEFLLVLDTAARVLTSLEIPISILTGLVGAPLYAWLLWKQKAKVL